MREKNDGIQLEQHNSMGRVSERVTGFTQADAVFSSRVKRASEQVADTQRRACLPLRIGVLSGRGCRCASEARCHAALGTGELWRKGAWTSRGVFLHVPLGRMQWKNLRPSKGAQSKTEGTEGEDRTSRDLFNNEM